MKNCVPVEKPGLVFKLKNYFILITSMGRKAGKVRQTPLEHRYDESNDRCLIISGWTGRPDWYRNVSASPTTICRSGIANSIAAPDGWGTFPSRLP